MLPGIGPGRRTMLARHRCDAPRRLHERGEELRISPRGLQIRAHVPFWLVGLCLGTSCVVQTPTIGISDTEVVDTFKRLHQPVYGVYALGPARDEIHALLSHSFVGEALTAEYIEHYTTLFRMVEDQTSIQVQRVDYESVTVLDRNADAIRVDADWSVGGVVTHQGHKHPRVNRYRAVYTLAETPDGMRIVNTRMRNLERVRSLLSSGDAWTVDDLPASGGGFMDPLDLLDAGVLDDIEKAEREAASGAAPSPSTPNPTGSP